MDKTEKRPREETSESDPKRVKQPDDDKSLTPAQAEVPKGGDQYILLSWSECGSNEQSAGNHKSFGPFSAKREAKRFKRKLCARHEQLDGEERETEKKLQCRRDELDRTADTASEETLKKDEEAQLKCRYPFPGEQDDHCDVFERHYEIVTLLSPSLLCK
jgi:hypothetical protein